MPTEKSDGEPKQWNIKTITSQNTHKNVLLRRRRNQKEIEKHCNTMETKTVQNL